MHAASIVQEFGIKAWKTACIQQPTFGAIAAIVVPVCLYVYFGMDGKLN